MYSLTSAGWVVRVAGLTVIVLGLLVWAGVAPGLVPVHILVGIVLVLALAATAILALRVGARPVLPAVAIAWGAFMLVFGLAQAQILAGDGHVVVQVAHLAVGLVAIGLGEALVGAGRQAARRSA